MTYAARQTIASLATLIILQAIMLSALYAGIRPHPPEATPLFGIAPFIGASISIALSAILVQPLGTKTGRGLSLLAAFIGLVSFGPQKYLDPQFGLIWPTVIFGQIAAVIIVFQVIRELRQADTACV